VTVLVGLLVVVALVAWAIETVLDRWNY